MIKKIIAFVLPFFCIIALFLKINGVDHIEFNKDYYDFMASVLQRSEKFTFAIPEIPPIPEVGNGFVDALAGLVNGFTSFLNVISVVINTLIKVLGFLLGLIESGINGLKDIIISNVAAFASSV